MARKSSFEPPELSRPSIGRLERCAIVVLGVYLSGVGIDAVTSGHLIYRNYLRTQTSALVAIAIGIVLVAAGLFVSE